MWQLQLNPKFLTKIDKADFGNNPFNVNFTNYSKNTKFHFHICFAKAITILLTCNLKCFPKSHCVSKNASKPFVTRPHFLNRLYNVLPNESYPRYLKSKENKNCK